MAKKKEFEIKGNLFWKSNDMRPASGKVNFGIDGADAILLRLIPIDASVLPAVLTGKHIEGEIVLTFREKKAESPAYVKNVEDEKKQLRVRRVNVPAPESRSSE